MSEALTRSRDGQYEGEPESTMGRAMGKWAGGVSPVPEDDNGNPLCWMCSESAPTNNVKGAICQPCSVLRRTRRDREANEAANHDATAWAYFRAEYRKLGKLTDEKERRRDRDELERRFLKAKPHYSGLVRRWVAEGYGDRQPGEQDKRGKGWS